jgi:signal transduction histidine kinase
MKILPSRTYSSVSLIVSLVAILVALAALQYRWSGQVSEAEHERMQTSLLASMNQFRLQFSNEFRQLGFLFQPNETILMRMDWKSYASTCDALLRRSDHHLIRNIYLWISGGNGNPQLLRLNRDAKAFEAASWPSSFETVRDHYGRFFPNPRLPEPEIRPFEWTMFSRIPLMLQPLVTFQSSPDSSSAGVQFVGVLMMELSVEHIHKELFPDLAKRNFEGPDGFIYQVAVVSGRDAGTLLYQSDPHLTIAAFAKPDSRVLLLENPPERFGPMGPGPGRSSGPRVRSGQPPPIAQFRPRPPSAGGRRDMGPIMSDDEGSDWELIAKHRQGSLEAAVTGLRRRNLAISFGSLLLLAVSMALIIVSARRAQSLARLQLDFVAGISHELRTPLAVICSAGDNLAEGVIGEAGHSARKYGELIRDEGRKLAGMIEQILQFAGMQRGRRHYTFHPEDINRIAASALKHAQPAILAAGFSVETSLAPGLPQVNVDTAAMLHVVQNLIQNSLKYSGESRWLAVRTAKTHVKSGVEVQLTIEDRGMGIASEDLPHIFEPFYRGDAAIAAQIHGTGLGLFMVREGLASMGGSISAKSTVGRGSAFTIHLPSLPPSDGHSIAAASGEPEHAIQNTVD